MANRAHDISYKAGELTGQAQMKKDEFLNEASDTLHSGQDNSYAAQATNFIQQTGEQVKSMAQGAAEAVKNTLGMNPDNSPTTHNTRNTNNPNNPSTRI